MCAAPRGLRGADTGRVVLLKTGIAHKKDESRGDQATREKKAAQRWCWYLSVIGALLITGKATSKLYKSFRESANEVFYRIIPNLVAEPYHGSHAVFPISLPFTLKPHLGEAGKGIL